jgi:hypothetical protein
MNRDVDDERLRRYLLGELPEEESAALEEQYFGADDVFAAVLAAEDALAEEYLRGGLSGPDRERFERRFLSTPDGRARLGIVRDVASRPAPRAGTRRTGLGLALPPLWRAAAAAAVLTAVAAGWLLTQGRDRRPPAVAGIEPRPGLPMASPPGGAASPHPKLAPAPPRPVPAEAVLSVTLAAGLVRDPGGMTAFEIPRNTTTLRLVLPLPRDEYPRYRVSLQTPEGSERASQDRLTPRGGPSGRSIEVRVPAKLLAPGTYVVIVSGLTADGRTEAAGEYVFRVTRPARSAAPSPATCLAPPDHMWAEHGLLREGVRKVKVKTNLKAGQATAAVLD